MHKLIYILLFFNFLIADSNLKKVTIQLSWFDQFQFAGYYMAKEKGYYKELGLDVNIKPFEFGIDIPSEVSKGTYEFAVGRETLILERANHKKIVALYALFQSSPLVLLSTKESKINSIQDFEGKKIMTTIDDAGEVSIKSMITSQKLNVKELNFIKHTHNINDLINKNTDVISAYTSKSPYHLKKMGIEYNIFAPKDYGFDMYSDLLYTNEKMIEKDLDTVLKFKKASLKGWEYAYNNQLESVNLIFDKYNTQHLTKDELMFEAKELKKLSYYNVKDLGDIKLSKLQRIYDLYNIMGLVPNKINIQDFVFDEKKLFNLLTKEEKNFIRENRVITVGVENNRKPFSYTDEVGLHKGILNDFINIISQQTGLKFIYDTNEHETLIEKFKNDEFDILSISLNSKIDNSLKTEPYFKLNENFFKIKNRNEKNIKKIGILNYLDERKIEKLLKVNYPNTSVVKFNNINSASDALKNMDIDLLYIPEEMMLTYIKDNHITNFDYINNAKPNSYPLFMITTNENKILNSILTKAIRNISIEQKIAIQNKWVPVMFEKKINWTQIILIGLLLLAVIIFIVYKQITLHTITNKLRDSEERLLKANDELKNLSEKDHLTQLYNRRYFESIAKKYISLAKREKSSTAILIFDIDNFKKINDNHGHKSGDIVLIDVSKLIKKFSRKSDIVARFGGEEFVILLPHTTLDGAIKFSESLRKEIETKTILVDNLQLNITVSMGLTTFKESESLYETLHRADESLYEAKRKGKNQLRYS